MLFKTRVKDSPGYIEILPQKCILIIMNHESHYLLPQPFYLKKKKKKQSATWFTAPFPQQYQHNHTIYTQEAKSFPCGWLTTVS